MVHVPKNKLVVLQGLHDFIVVEQNNMLLICPKDEEQSVKKIVADVKERFGPDFI
jgi:mannose-1-phosphate guanylyltransferase